MNTRAKKQKILIVILMSIVLMIGAFLGTFFSLNSKRVEAETYNYGTFNSAGYYTLDGVVFYAVKVKTVNGVEVEGTYTYNYWPTYTIVMKDGKPDFIEFGETVLLKDDEAILICFARQTASGKEDDAYIINNGNKLSASVDFLTGYVSINGIDQENEEKNSINEDEEIKQEFGYIFNLNNEIIIGQDNENLLGIANGLDGEINNEGLIEFTANYQVGSTLSEFNFMFYAFKESTYYREEPNNGKDRPSPVLKTEEALDLEHVTDSTTASQFYSEAFYYYKDQNLPYLEYDYTRYEVEISKNIHGNRVIYNLSYDNISTGKISPSQPAPSIPKIYAQDLRVELIPGTTKSKVYFADLGVYDLTYTAVYYNIDGDKVELDTLNENNLKDRMTIYGTQATYQDINKGQSSFRNYDNTISADVTGKGFSASYNGGALTLPAGFTEEMIASTNQPQVKFLFNSSITSGQFKVFYSANSVSEGTLTDVTDVTAVNNYTYNSNFTTPGYYYIIVINQYPNYKIWLGDSVQYSSTTEQTQIYFFQIKDQTPDLKIYQLTDEGQVPGTDPIEIYSGSYNNGVYTGSFAKNGVQIFEAEAISEFDSPVNLSIQYRAFTQTDAQLVTLNLNESPEILSTYGITKYDGYYVIVRDGHYSVKLKFGRNSSTSCLFDIDTESINGIKVYNVESVSGSSYYSATLIAEQGTFTTTNKAISLLWNQKASGAKITAKYVRFDLANRNYSDSYNSYKLNDTWLATDFAIVLSDTNPETLYNSANNVSLITSNSVLALDGLYIFKLEDEAGNIAYYSVLVDASIPTVLQKTAEGGEIYNKITGINNVSGNTEIFFGSHKAIPFVINDQLIKSSSTDLIDYLSNEESSFAEYFGALFNNLEDMGADDLIKPDGVYYNYYVVVPITKVAKTILEGSTINLTQQDIANGYHILEPETINGRIADLTYIYEIFDASNRNSKTPSRTYSVRVNTDKTGLAVICDDGTSTGIPITQNITGSQTAANLVSRTNYYRPVNFDGKIYLTWGDLIQDGFYVDLNNGGLTCYFYELIWNETKHSYEYLDLGTEVALDFSDISIDQMNNGSGEEGLYSPVKIEINVSSQGRTYAGMYQIIRTYSYNGEKKDLGNDYETVITTFFVDRNQIVTTPSSNDAQIGYYTYMTFFDGGDEIIFYNTLFQQSQSSTNYVVQTNKLPVGFYIHISKYGTVYDTDTDTNLTKSEIQSGDYSFVFEDLVRFTDLDSSVALGKPDTYSPYALRVVLISPSNIHYYYMYNAINGYFMLSGYSQGEVADSEIIPITNYSAFIAKNPITNNTQWETGTYKLNIGCIKQDNNDYLQKFYFLFNVVNTSPNYDLDANYPDLVNMETREIISGNDGNYYTNTNEILVSWIESNSNHLTKIDLNTIRYTYYIGGVATNKISGTDFNVISDGNSRSFVVTIPANATRVVITMSYEFYSTDTANLYRKYYGNSYTSSKTIIIDRIAPTSSIGNLINGDATVNGLTSNLLRALFDSQGNPLDTRFSKSITTGTYKYYSFKSSTSFIYDLASSLETNVSTNTKYFYYRYFPNKYTTSVVYETGLGLDSSAPASNIFSEHYAMNNGWSLVTSAVDEIYLSNNFSREGYYEFIEVDLAGNMTIYTIYLSNGSDLEIDYTYKISVNPENKTLDISENENYEIISYDYFNLNDISFVASEVAYVYIKVSIDNVSYLVTPFSDNVIRQDNGAEIALEDIILSARDTAHKVIFYDTVNNMNHNVVVKVENADARINYNIQSDNITLNNIRDKSQTLALIVNEKANATLKFDPTTLRIYDINEAHTGEFIAYVIDNNDIINMNDAAQFSKAYDDNSFISIEKITSLVTGDITYYFYINYKENTFNTSTFYFVFKDDFRNEYVGENNYVKYSDIEFDRYEYDGSDLTMDMQNSTDILVSKNIIVNFSNLFDIYDLTVNVNDTHYIDATGFYEELNTNGSYRQLLLQALNDIIDGYYGGLIQFKIELSSNIPIAILSELKEDYDFADISTETNILETLNISIYNQLPVIKITNNEGTDITDNLFNELITQSEPITISFNTENDLAEKVGYTSKVYLRLRGSSTGYYEITSPITISAPGIYDIFVQNFDQNGNPLDFIQSQDFVISNVDLIFYTVVKTNTEGEQEIVSPTGSIFSYTSGSSTSYVPYHYIVNTNQYLILTNGEKVTSTLIYTDSRTNTKIYRIKSISGTIFDTTIAVTVVSATTNILGDNGFRWYLGTTYTSTTNSTKITSTTSNIYLCEEDNYDEITIRWDSYYSTSYNKITCYISSDDGQTWKEVAGMLEGTSKVLTLKKSSIYLFKFVDKAGNQQIFTSISGVPSTTTRVTFIRSVIYKLNGNTPLDNSIYNENVTISLPISMNSYYSSTPTITAIKNNQEYQIAKDANGNYVFTEPGTYVIYFSVRVMNGTKNLNKDSLTFTIINPNDSRWAFNYVNYNGYVINHIKYNGVTISTGLRNFAIQSNEINISAFLNDVLGNKYFENGIYTIKITSIDDAIGNQSFEFNFWLNDAVPPITVSQSERETTTNQILVSFNETNLFETIGDCYVMINNQIISRIDENSRTLQEINLSNVKPYYIQIYTDSGKLAYSYRVEIVEPLNTITIILIVTTVAVMITGGIFFFLLRRRMKVR